MSDMKAVSRRVETDIKSSFSIVDQFFMNDPDVQTWYYL